MKKFLLVTLLLSSTLTLIPVTADAEAVYDLAKNGLIKYKDVLYCEEIYKGTKVIEKCMVRASAGPDEKEYFVEPSELNDTSKFVPAYAIMSSDKYPRCTGWYIKQPSPRLFVNKFIGCSFYTNQTFTFDDETKHYAIIINKFKKMYPNGKVEIYN